MENLIFSKIKEFSEKNHIRQPLIVGGVPRDIVLNRQLSPRDVDLTTNNSDVTRLAIGFAIENNIFYKIFGDLHVTAYIDNGPDLDFSSNFISKNAVDFFKGTKYSDKKYHEVISRDFSINTMHKSMFNNNIIDPLNMGINDCNDKILRCVTTPEISFSDDPRRAYRAIVFSSKFDLKIDGQIIDYLLKNKDSFSIKNPLISDTYIIHEIDKIIDSKEEALLNNLIDTGLFKNIPLIGKFKDAVIKNNLVEDYLDANKNTVY